MHNSYKTTSIVFFFLCFFLCLTSCDPDETDLSSPVGFDEALLINCWKHSYEEDASNTEDVLRPCDYKQFEASLYRLEFQLFEQDSCQYLELSPTDAHFLDSGTWTYDGTSLLTIFRRNGDLFLQQNILELESDKLVLEN